jgi:multicomponent Na+:H+ antiporter subunit G
LPVGSADVLAVEIERLDGLDDSEGDDEEHDDPAREREHQERRHHDVDPGLD